MNIYRTPGVYIEEVQTIPPAVAAVATAVPAFLGYTADATHADEAIRITSLLEFEQFFGGSPVTRVDLDITKRTTEGGALLGVDVALAGTNPAEPVPVELLHYAVKHYFANGGGPCWIYSLGAHGSNTTGDYTDGIAALEAVDEPTLLVFPGATRLTNAGDHESVVQAALESCLRTQDRFTIADVRDAMPGGLLAVPADTHPLVHQRRQCVDHQLRGRAADERRHHHDTDDSADHGRRRRCGGCLRHPGA